MEKDTGIITMKHGIPEGRYILQFKVYDRKHTQTDVPANVTVVVKEIPHEAVVNSGSFRIVGITAEDFVRIWDYEKEKVVKSKLELFKEKLASILPDQIPVSNIDVFSVMSHSKLAKTTDIRYSVHGSPYYKPVKLNGILLRHREDFEKELNINITMVGIDECLYENQVSMLLNFPVQHPWHDKLLGWEETNPSNIHKHPYQCLQRSTMRREIWMSAG